MKTSDGKPQKTVGSMHLKWQEHLIFLSFFYVSINPIPTLYQKVTSDARH